MPHTSLNLGLCMKIRGCVLDDGTASFCTHHHHHQRTIIMMALKHDHEHQHHLVSIIVMLFCCSRRRGGFAGTWSAASAAATRTHQHAYQQHEHQHSDGNDHNNEKDNLILVIITLYGKRYPQFTVPQIVRKFHQIHYSETVNGNDAFEALGCWVQRNCKV